MVVRTSYKRFFFNPKEVKGIMVRVLTDKQKVADKGVIVIKSEPSNAELYINGELYGRTPYNGKLSSGSKSKGIGSKGIRESDCDFLNSSKFLSSSA